MDDTDGCSVLKTSRRIMKKTRGRVTSIGFWQSLCRKCSRRSTPAACQQSVPQQRALQRAMCNAWYAYFRCSSAFIGYPETRPKYPPLSRDRCSNTPVALCFLWYRRLSLLHSHFFTSNGLSQSKDRPNEGVSQKTLASEAYCAIGGVARNSIANCAIVGH